MRLRRHDDSSQFRARALRNERNKAHDEHHIGSDGSPERAAHEVDEAKGPRQEEEQDRADDFPAQIFSG